MKAEEFFDKLGYIQNQIDFSANVKLLYRPFGSFSKIELDLNEIYVDGNGDLILDLRPEPPVTASEPDHDWLLGQQKAREALAREFDNITPEQFKEQMEQAIPAWAGSGEAEDEACEAWSEEPCLLVLNAEEWDRFIAEMENPSPPSQKLIELLQRPKLW